MPKATFLVLIAALSAVTITALPKSAHACSCFNSTTEEDLAKSAAVFEGRVLSVRRESSGTFPVLVELYVHRSWKGIEAGERITVNTGTSDGTCGVDFRIGENYVVFAWPHPDGFLLAGSCNTLKSADAATKLEELGPPTSGHAPTCGVARPGNADTSSLGACLAGGAALGLLGRRGLRRGARVSAKTRY